MSVERSTTILSTHDVERARPTPGVGPRSRTAVVGYDGSPVARAALSYAIERARPHGGLTIAYAIWPPPLFVETPYYERVMEAARSRAVELLDGIDVPALAEVSYTIQLLEGPPAASLVALARQNAADEVAVGSCASTRLRRALGGVAHSVLHEADRPVVVVPRAAAERTAERPKRNGGVTVVGYDGSRQASRALAYALETVRPGSRIVAVHAVEIPDDWITAAPGEFARDYLRRGEDVLAQLEAPPDLVERELSRGSPVEALSEAAERHDADEIVVGSRGLGRFRAALGSVSYGLLHEAARPVVVVRRRPREADAQAGADAVRLDV